ncbi:hypothetical protein AR688_17520 [Rheinheimera sp. EpRS3]|nr:hypothetical protein AR688_17520 [Rheinheimera sp. EpRS3]
MHRIRACYLPALLLTMLLLQVFAAPLDEVLLPAHFKYPNGIAHQQDGTVFVGSVTEGKILRVDKGGNIATFFADNAELNSVTAIRYDQHHHSLWVASPDFAGPRQGKQSTPRAHRLGFIDVASGKLRWVVDMPDNGFGNDFAIDHKGGAYLTDSASGVIWHVSIDSDKPVFTRVAAADELKPAAGEIGPAGIAVRSDGSLVVGMFSSGKLYHVQPGSDGIGKVSAIALDSPLENPDGMMFANEKILIIAEAGIASGNGKVSAIRFDTALSATVDNILTNLSTPLNLTLFEQQAWISEGQVAGFFPSGADLAEPASFRLIKVPLPH